MATRNEYIMQGESSYPQFKLQHILPSSSSSSLDIVKGLSLIHKLNYYLLDEMTTLHINYQTRTD